MQRLLERAVPRTGGMMVRTYKDEFMNRVENDQEMECGEQASLFYMPEKDVADLYCRASMFATQRPSYCYFTAGKSWCKRCWNEPYSEGGEDDEN